MCSYEQMVSRKIVQHQLSLHANVKEPDVSQSSEFQALKADFKLLQKKVDSQSSEISDIRQSAMTAASSATTSAEESRATRAMMGKLMAKFDTSEAKDYRAKLPTCTAATGEGPKPMFPKFVTLADHDMLWPFLGVGTRSDATTKHLREQVSEEGGLDFQDWWGDLVKIKPMINGERNLLPWVCLKVFSPMPLVKELERSSLGT